MISYLLGKISEINKNFIILEVNEVGYRIYMSNRALKILAENLSRVNKFLNKKTIIYTSSIFDPREGYNLYGFLNKNDLEMFELLISISGVGPKNALKILSSIDPEKLSLAVLKNDPNYLQKITNLSPKISQRLIIELKDKIDRKKLAKFAKLDLDLTQESQAIDALVSLGYSQNQAKEALNLVPKKFKNLEDKVKEALKILSKA